MKKLRLRWSGMARRPCAVLVATLGATALLVVGAPSGAQTEPTLTVTKIVTGAVPAGTTFTVEVSCLTPLSTGGTGSTTTTTTPVQAAIDPTATIVFNAQGAVISGMDPVPIASLPTTCTATETVTGGAASVTSSCAVGSGGPTEVSCETDSSVFYGPDASGGAATVTVTNAFPAAAVVTPLFTG